MNCSPSYNIYVYISIDKYFIWKKVLKFVRFTKDAETFRLMRCYTVLFTRWDGQDVFYYIFSRETWNVQIKPLNKT